MNQLILKLELPEYYNDIEKLHKLQEDIESAESQYEELFEMLEEYED